MRKTVAVNTDLELAFHLADLADAITLRWWSPNGVASTAKADGSPVTEADVAAEKALLNAVRNACPGDGFLGEEVGEKQGTTGRRWIVDGIDGTRSFVAGQPEWGTLIALERDNEINLGISRVQFKSADGGQHEGQAHSAATQRMVSAVLDSRYRRNEA